MTSLKYIQKISAQTIEIEDPLPKKESNSIFSSPSCLSLSLSQWGVSLVVQENRYRGICTHTSTIYKRKDLSQRAEKRERLHTVLLLSKLQSVLMPM
jgi:hypothetical protein